MNQSANRAFRHFAGNRSLPSTPLVKIQTLATGYPFFPVAQFFLAKKLKEEYDDAYINQSQKAVLYFYNPFLFDHLLSAELAADTEMDEREETMATTGQHELFAQHEEENTTTFSEAREEIAMVIPAEMTIEKLEIPVEDTAYIPASKEEKSIANNTPVTNDHDEVNTDETTEPDEHEKMYRNIKAMLDATSEEADADVNNTEIPIDPYHTIDYFASQGIKLDFDVNPQDKLGQNLKRFTQWLRHMKKLGPEDAKVELENSESEADIKKMADTSNTVKEVVTEAMAAVLEKQGKKDKAIELYNKLSFLNPDKSAYFAAQIEKLKGF